jgi:uncharacterized protein YceH (UPF0502 family)
MELPILEPTELRVLGTLMEKARITPDYYPMTINGLTAACNQKTSRNPVVNYDEATVVRALDSLKKRGLVSTATGAGSRVVKYKHNFAIVFPVVPAEVAIISLLMLRGAQTPGELNTNAGRMYEFESIDEVQQVLEKLATDKPSYVVQLSKRAGQKEARYAHLLGGTPEINEDDYAEPAPRVTHNALEERVNKLEQELTELRQAFDDLLKQLT